MNSDSDMVRVVVVGVGIEAQVRLPSCRHHGFANTVLHEVVIEVSTRCQAQNQVRDFRFRIIGHVPHIAQSVIPMITAYVFIELERVARKRGENSPYSFGCVDPERFSVTAPANFEFLSAADEVVVYRIEREQHPHASVWLRVQHEQVAVSLSADVNSHAVAQPRVVLAQPELHGRIVLLRDCCHWHICDSYG